MIDLGALRPAEFCAELVWQGLLTADQAEIVLTEHAQRGGTVADTVASLGILSVNDILALQGSTSALAPVRLGDSVADPQALGLIPRSVAQAHGVVPIGFDADQNQLTVAIADPNDVVAMDKVRAGLPPSVGLEWRLATRAEIEVAVEAFYGQPLSIEAILQGLRTGRIVEDGSSHLRGPRSHAHPIVRLVDALLAEAVRMGASDIHLEPEERFLRVRYRVDGVLRQIRVLHRQYWPAMIVRLKVMSDMDIAETRAPQDGRISMVIMGHDVDFRAAVQPTVHGENFVLRVLDRRKSIVRLDNMGLAPDRLATLRLMLARPYGIVLVTGPTGSGKTTTLYSILDELNTEQVNIMTLEDPVEYPMPRIRQASAGETKLDFASGVRSMMRQDPDIILVGEIRDRETAEMAFRAAMTGHQVFSTLHANSAVLAIPRLIDMGVPTAVLTGNIIGIVAQRLVRKLCLQCREAYAPSPPEKALLRLGDDDGAMLYRPVGCPACGGAGYRGRVALMELLRFDETMDDMVAQGSRASHILAHARKEGYSTMAEDAVRRVAEGVTSLEEVARVVDLTRFGHG